MTPLLLLVLCIAVTQANWQRPSGISHADAFAKFNAFWNKGSRSNPAETAIRLANFIANALKIDSLNAARSSPHHATFGYTIFADLSPSEFKQLMGFQPIDPPKKRDEEQFWVPRPPRTPPSAPKAPTSPPRAPTRAPTQAPTNAPTQAPTQAPTNAPTQAPTQAPTSAPTQAPTNAPFSAPTQGPISAPVAGSLAAIDWVARGMTTPVKDQGRCGSCWAQAAVETVESANLIAGNPMTIGSPQQITSCATSAGSGCGGGDYYAALTWVKNTNLGIATNSCYPYASATYKSGTTGTCTTQCSSDPNLKISSVARVAKTEAAIYNALTLGPVAIAVDASEAWQLYTGGIMAASSCTGAINHAVQLTGFSPEGGGYWIVRNSWGKGWGEDGFIRLAYGTDTCSITEYPVTAKATGPAASQQTVPTAGGLKLEGAEQSSGSPSNTGAIVGGVVGGVVGLLLLAGIIVGAVVYLRKPQSETF